MSTGTIYTTGEYLDGNPTWHVEDSAWKAAHIETIVRRNQLSPKRIAEVGCGAGQILAELWSRLADDVEFFGFEVSPQAYDLCKPLERERLHFHLEDLASQEQRFDLLLVIDVIEHVDDYLGFMRSLAPKCDYAAFHIPLDISAQAVLRKSSFDSVREEVGHIHYFTEETAIASVREAGYRVVDCFLTAGAIELSGGGLKRRVASLPRRALAAINPSYAAKLLGGFSLMVLAKAESSAVDT
ncbi:MAG: methyltransferase domain-containing protein [Planctomycetota bacterium]